MLSDGSGNPFFETDNFLGPFDITGLLEDGDNTLYIYTRDHGAASGIQYKFTITSAQTSGNSGHEPPTIGKSLDGVRQVVNGGMAIDDQTWTVTQGYHQEFELLQMLTSPHTISNVINCSKGVQYCNYIAETVITGLLKSSVNPMKPTAM